MNTGKSTITTNTGCKYPGTPEPCEGYREAMEVLAEAEEALRQIHERTHDFYCRFELGIANCDCHHVITEEALTRINRLKGINQLREKE